MGQVGDELLPRVLADLDRDPPGEEHCLPGPGEAISDRGPTASSYGDCRDEGQPLGGQVFGRGDDGPGRARLPEPRDARGRRDDFGLASLDQLPESGGFIGPATSEEDYRRRRRLAAELAESRV